MRYVLSLVPQVDAVLLRMRDGHGGRLGSTHGSGLCVWGAEHCGQRRVIVSLDSVHESEGELTLRHREAALPAKPAPGPVVLRHEQTSGGLEGREVRESAGNANRQQSPVCRPDHPRVPPSHFSMKQHRLLYSPISHRAGLTSLRERSKQQEAEAGSNAGEREQHVAGC